MSEALLTVTSRGESSPEEQSPVRIPTTRTINLLAYVHLRNIYRSTGAGRVARQLTEHLAKREDIRLRILSDKGDHSRIIPMVGAPWNGFSYRFFPHETSRQQALWYLKSGARAEKFWPEADVMFCTMESYVPTRRARLAVTLHDAAYLEEDGAHRHDWRYSLQRFKWKFLYRRLEQEADLFHTVSQFSADRLSHFLPGIRPRVRVVHNAVTPHFFEPVTAAGLDYLDEHGLAERAFVLVPGGLHFRKNAELILEAWPLLRRAHPNLQLVVVNHSNPHYVEQTRRFGRDFKVLGFAPDDGLRALYSAAQTVWFPSRYEGFGLPVLEAMACGTPVVASNASSLPEIAGKAAILVPATDAQKHVEAISAVVSDTALAGDLSRKGLARAQTFTWQKSAAELKAHFEELL